jgi:hypothetical protein
MMIRSARGTAGSFAGRWVVQKTQKPLISPEEKPAVIQWTQTQNHQFPKEIGSSLSS